MPLSQFDTPSCGLDLVEDAGAGAVDLHLSAYDPAIRGAGILILIIESTGNVAEKRADLRPSVQSL
jgi:hypothetical protein